MNLNKVLERIEGHFIRGYGDSQKPDADIELLPGVVEEAEKFLVELPHGLAFFTEQFETLERLGAVDWEMVYQRYWSDNVTDMDRQRRKQAEFLVHRSCPWSLIQEIAVIDEQMRGRVEAIQTAFPVSQRKLVKVERQWYY